MFDWVKTPPKTTKELQAELKALVARLVGQQYGLIGDWGRYEELLKEIYLRGEEPEVIIKGRRT